VFRREFIGGIEAGAVTFHDQTLYVPAGVAPRLGRVLDELLPESDVFGGLAGAHPDDVEPTALEWYLVLRGMVAKIVVSIAADSSPRDDVQFTLDHEFVPAARIVKVGAHVDHAESGDASVARGTRVEILHESGSWTIGPRRSVDRGGIGSFVSAVLKEMTRR